MFSVAGRNYSRWVTRLHECRSNPTIKMILWKRFLKSYSVMLPIYFSKWRDAILFLLYFTTTSLHLRHNERDGVSNHQPQDCLLNCLFRRRSKKTSKLRVTDLCAGNSPVTGEFRAQMASNAENASIFLRHHDWGLNKVGTIVPAKFWIEFSWMKIVVFYFQRRLFQGAN